eukprot:scaffold302285_cov18-Tisochrysis_lutea.AAC.1
MHLQQQLLASNIGKCAGKEKSGGPRSSGGRCLACTFQQSHRSANYLSHFCLDCQLYLPSGLLTFNAVLYWLVGHQPAV